MLRRALKVFPAFSTLTIPHHIIFFHDALHPKPDSKQQCGVKDVSAGAGHLVATWHGLEYNTWHSRSLSAALDHLACIGSECDQCDNNNCIWMSLLVSAGWLSLPTVLQIIHSAAQNNIFTTQRQNNRHSTPIWGANSSFLLECTAGLIITPFYFAHNLSRFLTLIEISIELGWTTSSWNEFTFALA